MALQLVTVTEAARMLAVHEDTVRRLIERGQLPATRIGRNVRIEVAELIALVRRRASAADAKHEQQPQITEGQIRALHAKAGRLDKELKLDPRTSKKIALRLASEHYGRLIESTLDLNAMEAHWVLERLDVELERVLAGE